MSDVAAAADRAAADVIREIRCPFYGASLIVASTRTFVDDQTLAVRFGPSPYLIVSEPSNRCALITSAHSPCVMKICGRDPQWSACNRNPEINGSYVSPLRERS